MFRGDLYLRRWFNKKVDLHTCKSVFPAAPASSAGEPLLPQDTAETGGNKRGRRFSFELHRSEVLSKHSQVQIFLSREEEGQGVKEEQAVIGGGAGKKRVKVGESSQQKKECVCIPLGVKR